jgi:hypothetical protein
MNPLSVDIKDLLESSNLGIFGTNLFIGKEPTSPSNCVTLYDTGGSEQNARLALDEGTIQVRSRNTDYRLGYDILDSIKMNIEGRNSIEINETIYVGFWTISNIAYITQDDIGRSIFTINFRVMREPKVSDRGHRQPVGGI